MEAMEIEEYFLVKKSKPSQKMLKMREASLIFNSSKSIEEFKVKLNLAGIDFDKLEKDYTDLVASNWPKFLERFKEAKRDVFSFKKYMKIPAMTNTFTGIIGKPRLPWEIKKSRSGKISIKCAAREDADRSFGMTFSGETEIFANLDVEADLVNTMLYEISF